MARHRRLLLGALGLATALGVAGCSGGGSGAKTPTATAPPPAPTARSTPASRYPLTITDMLDRTVTIAKEPVFVAAVGPIALNYVYLVGGTSTTRASSVTGPPLALSAVDIGPASQPSFDAIRATKPDLVIADAVTQAQLRGQFEALGVPVVYIGATTYSGAQDGVRLVGSAINRQQTADKRVTDEGTTMATIVDQLPASRPRLVILAGAPGNYVAATAASYVGNLTAIMEGKNIAADHPEVADRPGFAKLTMEEILAAKPNVILTITDGVPGAPTLADAIKSDPAWRAVPAIVDKRVFEIDAETYLREPGLDAADALLGLAKLLYPGVFAQ